jgi:hypothetical protein
MANANVLGFGRQCPRRAKWKPYCDSTQAWRDQSGADRAHY